MYDTVCGVRLQKTTCASDLGIINTAVFTLLLQCNLKKKLLLSAHFYCIWKLAESKWSSELSCLPAPRPLPCQSVHQEMPSTCASCTSSSLLSSAQKSQQVRLSVTSQFQYNTNPRNQCCNDVCWFSAPCRQSLQKSCCIDLRGHFANMSAHCLHPL